MSQYKSQVQNQFLSAARKKHLKVEVILETGTVLRGKVQAYDQFSISLSFKDKVEVVYKSSIIYISVLPQRPMPTRRPSGPRTSSGGGYRPSSSDSHRPDSPPRPDSPRPKRDYAPPAPPKRSFPDFDEDADLNDPPPPKKPVRRKV
ncbi:MAG: RNA chaperone Hfq [Candidatus Rifleibacteriota bacterium]